MIQEEPLYEIRSEEYPNETLIAVWLGGKEPTLIWCDLEKSQRAHRGKKRQIAFERKEAERIRDIEIADRPERARSHIEMYRDSIAEYLPDAPTESIEEIVAIEKMEDAFFGSVDPQIPDSLHAFSSLDFSEQDSVRRMAAELRKEISALKSPVLPVIIKAREWDQDPFYELDRGERISEDVFKPSVLTMLSLPIVSQWLPHEAPLGFLRYLAVFVPLLILIVMYVRRLFALEWADMPLTAEWLKASLRSPEANPAARVPQWIGVLAVGVAGTTFGAVHLGDCGAVGAFLAHYCLMFIVFCLALVTATLGWHNKYESDASFAAILLAIACLFCGKFTQWQAFAWSYPTPIWGHAYEPKEYQFDRLVTVENSDGEEHSGEALARIEVSEEEGWRSALIQEIRFFGTTKWIEVTHEDFENWYDEGDTRVTASNGDDWYIYLVPLIQE